MAWRLRSAQSPQYAVLMTVYSSTLNTLCPNFQHHISSDGLSSIHQMSVHLCVCSVLSWCHPDTDANHFAVLEVKKSGKWDNNGAYRVYRKHCKSLCPAWPLTASLLAGCNQSQGCTVEPLWYSCFGVDTSFHWLCKSVKQHVGMSCSCAVYLQAGVPQLMQDQVDQLDRLHWLLADTTRLVSAVGRVEGNAAAKSTLQVCSLLSRQMLTSPI